MIKKVLNVSYQMRYHL